MVTSVILDVCLKMCGVYYGPTLDIHYLRAVDMKIKFHWRIYLSNLRFADALS